MLIVGLAVEPVWFRGALGLLPERCSAPACGGGDGAPPDRRRDRRRRRRPGRSAGRRAARARSPTGSIRAPYADPIERTLRWLHEQTSGDWVFRIDDDEMPSQTLLDVLAAPPGDVTHCFVPRRWLWRDGWLDAFPWRPDWQLRLARRDAVALPGRRPHPGARRRPGALPRGAALPPRPAGERPRGAGGQGAALRGDAPRPARRRPSAERGLLRPRVARPVRRAGPRGRPAAGRPDARCGRAGAGRRAGAAVGDEGGDRRGVGAAAAARERLPGLDRAARDGPVDGGRGARPRRARDEPRHRDLAVRPRRPARDPALLPGPAGCPPDAAPARPPARSERRRPRLGARAARAGEAPDRARSRPRRTSLVRLWRACLARRSCPAGAPSCCSGSRPATPRTTRAWTGCSPASTRRSSRCSSAPGPTGCGSGSDWRRRPARPGGARTRCSCWRRAGAGTGSGSHWPHVGFAVHARG